MGSSYFLKTIPFTKSLLQVFIVNLGYIGIIWLIYCPFSPCSNSESWSQHQICDTSFSCITLLVLLKVKFYVFGYL